MQHAMHIRATIRVADRTDLSARVTADEVNLDRFRKVCVLAVATLILPTLAISFAVPTFAQQKDAVAAEKKKIMGHNKHEPPIARTVVSLGDDPKHELTVLSIHRVTTTSSDPDFNETEMMFYEQDDEVAGTGTHRGYYRRLHKNGDIDYGTYEGTHKASVKEDGSWLETTWEGTWKSNGGAGKFKNIKGGGTYQGKATAQEAFSDFEGEVEY
jgi:hypothetical protein